MFQTQNKTGSACGFTNGGTACAAPADNAASCTLVTSDIAADADCALRTILGCKKHATNNACIANDACTDVTPTGTTDDAKTTSCQANIGPDSKYCTFTSGDAKCVAAQSACSGYSSLPSDDTKLAFCQLKINEKGQRCTWVTPATACSDPSGQLEFCQARIKSDGLRCSWVSGTTCTDAQAA
ncbi:unnamed protein product (macronuclear) [Paramecium tetraurelia]|uniref:Uncharacterized protein n=1 Tax=Paramecium tetraurelia TaxID=5888 RepID=A0C1T7_PARTE|nr:uncharacterized protein GSPATT00034231001 [Paramecium tetraurelia]CAK64754.1 unnamed protein product [Paramecium tetraurelia]|eukprot:XP_001432151.1 hypothetical protein (macronuclear) [Paramecium tetraurelia strain d4-2]